MATRDAGKTPGLSKLMQGLWISVLLLGSTMAVAETRPVYTLAVVPQLPALTTHKMWAPFIQHLEQDTGLDFELKIYSTSPEFEVDMLAGKPDFVFMNPYHQIMGRRAQGYIPLIRDNAKLIYGIVVVARDGPIKNINDLKGKEIAFPAPNAYAASLYIRALLSVKERLDYRPRYLATHTDVYRHVILGKAAAGGAVNTTLERETDSVRSQLRILYQTPASAPHPLSVHPRIAASVGQTLQAAIIALESDPTQREMLKGVQLMQPVQADYERDYQPLEKLGLEKFIVDSH